MPRKRLVRREKKRLRIVQVISNAPNARPVPSAKHGGTEKIVYELTEALVRRGHDVYLFAAKGSRSSAKLITYPKNLKSKGIAKFVFRKLPPLVDIIHDHTFRSELGRRQLRIPTVCTIHMPSKQHVKNPVYVSRRAQLVIGKNRGFYVHNGINPREYGFSNEKYGYLLFMGRIIREKGILQALDIADQTGKRLVIAGPIKDPVLFRKKIAPRMLRNPNIRYIGAVGGKQKAYVLKHAECLIFPTLWEEPFGLVMIEAMACGTPVLALRNGAVPEVLAAFPYLICNSVAEIVSKVRQNRYPQSTVLRRYVMNRFTNNKMTNRYLKIYHTVMQRSIYMNMKRKEP